MNIFKLYEYSFDAKYILHFTQHVKTKRKYMYVTTTSYFKRCMKPDWLYSCHLYMSNYQNHTSKISVFISRRCNALNSYTKCALTSNCAYYTGKSLIMYNIIHVTIKFHKIILLYTKSYAYVYTISS